MKKIFTGIKTAAKKYSQKRELKKKMNARAKKGRKGITPEALEIQRKNMLWLGKYDAVKKSLDGFRKKIIALEKEVKNNPKKEIELDFLKVVAKAVEKGELSDIKQFSESFELKSTNLAANLSTKYGLDAIKEFNPETRKAIRRQVEIIRNGVRRKDMYSVTAGENALKEIDKILGKQKGKKFKKYYTKTGKKLFGLAKELTRNPYKVFFISIK